MYFDVLIIGGGVIGLSIARELHKKGVQRVAIVDRGKIGGEASWAAAGMLAPDIEVDECDEFRKFCTDSLRLYPRYSESLLAETGVDIELDRSGTLFLAFSGADANDLRSRYERERKAGRDVEHLSASDVIAAESVVSGEVREGIFFPNDWQVENRKLLDALRRSSEINRDVIFERTQVTKILTDDKRVIGARTSAGDQFAGTTVLATGAWTSLIKIGNAAVRVSVRPIRGQMICFQAASRELDRVVFSPRGYIVPRADGRVLVGATVEDVGFDTSVTAAGIESLSTAAFEIVPRLAQLQVSDRWAGLRPFAADGLPVIGELPGFENAFVATAHYRNGILLAPKTAEVLADRIVDNVDSEVLDTFGAARFASAATTAGV